MYLRPRWCRTKAEICLDGRQRLHPDGWPLVLGAGADGAVGGGTGGGLPLEELQDGLDVCCHLGLQSDGQTWNKTRKKNDSFFQKIYPKC